MGGIAAVVLTAWTAFKVLIAGGGAERALRSGIVTLLIAAIALARRWPTPAPPGRCSPRWASSIFAAVREAVQTAVAVQPSSREACVSGFLWRLVFGVLVVRALRLAVALGAHAGPVGRRAGPVALRGRRLGAAPPGAPRRPGAVAPSLRPVVAQPALRPGSLALTAALVLAGAARRARPARSTSPGGRGR